MASIERKGIKNGEEKFTIVVSNGYRIDGSKIRVKKTVALPASMSEKQKKKELNQLACQFESLVQNGKYLEGNKITLAEFIQVWMKEYAEKKYVPATLHVYKMRIEKRIIPSLGHICIAKLQPHHIMQFCSLLSKEGIRLDRLYCATKQTIELLQKYCQDNDSNNIGISRTTWNRILKGQGISEEIKQKISKYFTLPDDAFTCTTTQKKLSSRTIKHHFELLSSILSKAVKWKVIDENPVLQLEAPKVKTNKIQFYGYENLQKLFACLEHEPLKYKAAIYIEIDTGLRLSELVGLNWQDIDLEKRLLKLSNQRQYIAGYGIFEKEPKTESGIRDIIISNTTKTILLELKKTS